jgi:CRP-like cAMP-binding protein
VNYSELTNDGQEILLGRLVPGDVLGLGSLLSEPTSYLGTAQAVRDSEVLVWDYRLIRHLASAYPRLTENALRIALDSIALHAARHIGLRSKSARKRVACALTRLGMRAGRVVPLGIEVNINNEDLASLADVNVFTAIRSLKTWERMGIVEKSRGKVLIRRPEKLLVA